MILEKINKRLKIVHLFDRYNTISKKKVIKVNHKHD